MLAGDVTARVRIETSSRSNSLSEICHILTHTYLHAFQMHISGFQLINNSINQPISQSIMETKIIKQAPINQYRIEPPSLLKCE